MDATIRRRVRSSLRAAIGFALVATLLGARP